MGVLKGLVCSRPGKDYLPPGDCVLRTCAPFVPFAKPIVSRSQQYAAVSLRYARSGMPFVKSCMHIIVDEEQADMECASSGDTLCAGEHASVPCCGLRNHEEESEAGHVD